jgi:hypothetical protein
MHVAARRAGRARGRAFTRASRVGCALPRARRACKMGDWLLDGAVELESTAQAPYPQPRWLVKATER